MARLSGLERNIAYPNDKTRDMDKYSELLQMTREGVSHLELLEDDYVNIVYNNGYKRKVDIACNSGMAIIRDVARHVQ